MQFDYSPPGKHLQFTYLLPEKSLCINLFTTKQNILQLTYSPQEKYFAFLYLAREILHNPHTLITKETFRSSPIRHQRNILQFTYSPPEKHFCSSPTRRQRNIFAVHIFATRENMLRFTYSPPEKTFSSSPACHQRKHSAIRLLTTRETFCSSSTRHKRNICSSPNRHQRKHAVIHLLATTTRGNMLYFTFSPLGKHFAVHLLHQRNSFTFHLLDTREYFAVIHLSTRENIWQFTYSLPEKTFGSTLTRHQWNILQFSNSPPENILQFT